MLLNYKVVLITGLKVASVLHIVYLWMYPIPQADRYGSLFLIRRICEV